MPAIRPYCSKNRPLIVNKLQLAEYVTLNALRFSQWINPIAEYFAPVAPAIDAPSARLINYRNYRADNNKRHYWNITPGSNSKENGTRAMRAMGTRNETSNFHRAVHALINETTVSRRTATSSLSSIFLSDKYGRRLSEMLYETQPLESALWSRAIPLLHFIGRTNTVDFFLTHTIYFFFYLSGRIADTPDCLGKRVIHSSIITRGIVSCDTKFPAVQSRGCHLAFDKDKKHSRMQELIS